VKNLLVGLPRMFERAHVHVWKESAWNRYQVATEQTCRCGERRWHDLCDYRNGPHEPPTWRHGEHPVAADMRAKGIERNY
jgi:hypothetical protein